MSETGITFAWRPHEDGSMSIQIAIPPALAAMMLGRAIAFNVQPARTVQPGWYISRPWPSSTGAMAPITCAGLDGSDILETQMNEWLKSHDALTAVIALRLQVEVNAMIERRAPKAGG